MVIFSSFSMFFNEFLDCFTPENNRDSCTDWTTDLSVATAQQRLAA
jgi:hypothetical protein